VPFDFLKRKKDAPEPDAAPVTPDAESIPEGERGIPFDGLTDEWHIVGRMHVDNRLSDALNRREPIKISDVLWAPIDGSEPLSPAAGLRNIDPYDLIIVMAGETTLPPLTEAERTAHKVHKVPYEVALDVPPFRVIGTVYLFPGSDPDRILDRATEMFVPVVDASAYLGEQLLQEDMDAILVNRSYLRGIEQIDRRTGEPHPPLPGSPMGGTSWQDRSR
jgi:hypothetical protein